tara:strand:- start:77 stop:292 length:216 start_codon:yes stop_codon:yes gene_type:complete
MVLQQHLLVVVEAEQEQQINLVIHLFNLFKELVVQAEEALVDMEQLTPHLVVHKEDQMEQLIQEEALVDHH